MIKFDNQSKITEVKKQSSNKKKEAQVQQSHRGSAMRPHVVDAKVYKVKSAFVKNSVFITLSYVKENKETVINSKVDEHITSLFKQKGAIEKIYAPIKIKNRIYNNYNVNDFYDYHIDSFKSSGKIPLHLKGNQRVLSSKDSGYSPQKKP